MLQVKRGVICVGITTMLMISMGTQAAEIKLAKVIRNTAFSNFRSIYIEEVEANSVSYGEIEKEGKKNKGLEEAKATLPKAIKRLRENVGHEIAFIGLPCDVLPTPPALHQNKSDTTPSATDSILGLSLEISKFDPGSRLKRAFLGAFGVGKTRVGVKGEFFDYKTTDPIVQFYHERYAAWTYAGEGPDRLLFNAIDDIAKDLAGYLRDHWTGQEGKVR